MDSLLIASFPLLAWLLGLLLLWILLRREVAIRCSLWSRRRLGLLGASSGIRNGSTGLPRVSYTDFRTILKAIEPIRHNGLVRRNAGHRCEVSVRCGHLNVL